jgi:hypothetical protein
MSFFRGLFSGSRVSHQGVLASILLGGALTMSGSSDRNLKYRKIIYSYLQSPIYQTLFRRRQAECYASE